MTRRERHIRILDSFGGTHGLTGRQIDSLIMKNGFSVFTDEAIEKLATNVVEGWNFTQRLNRQNRNLARTA